MSEDWKPGDLALCINSDGWSTPGDPSTVHPGPRTGQISQVAGVWVHWFPEGLIEALEFSAWPNDSFRSDCFVKVTPGHDIEGNEIAREAFTKGNPWKVPV